MITKMRTALYDRHCKLGARIVDFNGWEMPLHYRGIVEEHHAVRNRVGIFDVSHMGRILFSGGEAEQFVDYLSTNRIAGKGVGRATYTVFADEEGGSIDDAIVYRAGERDFFTVVNAGNRQKDYDHFCRAAKEYDVEVANRYGEEGILALQGPKALSLVHRLIPESRELKPFTFTYGEVEGRRLIISRTGYTGEEGVEIYAPVELLPHLFDLFLLEGKEEGIQPIGLGARDTLRLEAGYALYGHELSPSIMAVESVSAWTVKFKGRDFLGKEALFARAESPKRRYPAAIALSDRGVAREGYSVLLEGSPIGTVTSGTMSPTLQKAIALILADRKLEVGSAVAVDIRGKPCSATVVALPFYKSI